MSHFSFVILCLPEMAGGKGESQRPRLEGSHSIKEEGGEGWGEQQQPMGHSPLEGCNEASRSAVRLSYSDSGGDPAWQPLSLAEPLVVTGSGVC